MSKEDLIPFNKMAPEQARKIQQMGGKTVSPQKRLKAKLREMKKQGIDDEYVKNLIEIMECPEMSALDIRTFLDDIKRKQLTVAEKIKLGSLLITWHKATHGEKYDIKTENISEMMREDTKDWLNEDISNGNVKAVPENKL
jgi:hypothetical protein